MGGDEEALETAKRAVVRVGHGRGFIVGAGDDRYVITAAHCLPRSRYPRPHLANGLSELTFPKIIGPLGSKERTFWGELCAISLTDDLAVFCEPDGQALWDQCAEYEAFTETAIMIGKPPDALASYLWKSDPGMAAFVLSLDGEWRACTVHNGGRFLSIINGGVKGGMSGSPIINADGVAIGVISTSDASGAESINPCLMDCLPPWLLRKLNGVQAASGSSGASK
jgi:hypothetical protein